MVSRRRFLQSAVVGGTGILAGCSSLGGGSSLYPDGLPARSAMGDTSMRGARRYDLAGLREHIDAFHPDCGESAGVCAFSVREDGPIDEEFEIQLADVATVVAGGGHRLNSHPRSLASSLGMYAFRIVEYTVPASDVESALAERFTEIDDDGTFRYYRTSEDGEAEIADDGSRLILGLPDAIRTVAGRLGGEHESFTGANADLRTVREHVAPTTVEVIDTGPPDDEAPDWYEHRTGVGKGVGFGDSGVEYRAAMVFGSEAAQARVTDADVGEWANEEFWPVAEYDATVGTVFDVQRTGRSIVVTGSLAQYVGLA